jgi:PAS domain S-box-containing protein
MMTDPRLNFARPTARNPAPGAPPFSEEGLLALLAFVPTGCILFDSDFRIRFWNAVAERIFGYSQAEMSGLPPTKLISLDQAGGRFDLILKTTHPGETSTFDLESLSKDGSLRICRWQCTPLRIEEAGWAGYLAIVQDITAEKKADEKTHRQLDRIRALRSIDTAISGSLDIRSTLNVVLQQAQSQLKMNAAIILVYDSPSGMLKFACGRGLRTDVLQSTSLRIGEGYAGQAALRKQAIKVPDLQRSQKEFPHLPRFQKEGFESYYCVPLVAKGEIKGVMESFHRAPFHPDAEWLDFFETLGGQAAIAIENAALFNDLQRSNMELMLAYDTTLEGWSKALDLRDRDTEGHTQRVVQMTERLAAAVNISQTERIHIHRGAILHDIGKMGIPDNILLKEGTL